MQKYLERNIDVTDAREPNLRGENICISPSKHLPRRERDQGNDIKAMIKLFVNGQIALLKNLPREQLDIILDQPAGLIKVT